MDAEFVHQMDALYIIMFQLIVSTVVMKWKTAEIHDDGFLFVPSVWR